MALLTQLMMVLSIAATAFGQCDTSRDYSPCRCQRTVVLDPPGFYSTLSCRQVTVPDKARVFADTGSEVIDKFYWELSPEERVVSLNSVLGLKKFSAVEIRCPSTAMQLSFEASAFSSGLVDTPISLTIESCNLNQQENYEFLADEIAGIEGENVLLGSHFTEIIIRNAINLPHLIHLPPVLSQLSLLRLSVCKFSGDVIDPSNQLDFPSLTSMHLFGCWLTDDVIEHMLIHVKALNLETLDLGLNELSRIPDRLPGVFPKLQNLFLNTNYIRVIPARSLSFQEPVKILDLQSNRLVAIEPGAFQGNFSIAKVKLDSSNVTRLDSDVFQSMVEDMSVNEPTLTSSSIGLYMNPIQCDCSLAWLIRDNPDWIDHFIYARCSNFTYFNQLDPEGYANCADETDASTPSTEAVSPTTDGTTTTAITTGAPTSTPVATNPTTTTDVASVVAPEAAFILSAVALATLTCSPVGFYRH